MAEIFIETDSLFDEYAEAFNMSQNAIGESKVGNAGVVNNEYSDSWVNTYNFAQISQVTLRMFFIHAVNLPRSVLPEHNTNSANRNNGLYLDQRPNNFPHSDIAAHCEDPHHFRVKYDQLWTPTLINRSVKNSLREAASSSVDDITNSLVQRAFIRVKISRDLYHIYLITGQLQWRVDGNRVVAPTAHVTCLGHSLPVAHLTAATSSTIIRSIPSVVVAPRKNIVASPSHDEKSSRDVDEELALRAFSKLTLDEEEADDQDTLSTLTFEGPFLKSTCEDYSATADSMVMSKVSEGPFTAQNVSFKDEDASIFQEVCKQKDSNVKY